MDAHIMDSVVATLVGLVGTPATHGLLLGRVDPTGRLFYAEQATLEDSPLDMDDPKAVYPVGAWLQTPSFSPTILASDYDFLSEIGARVFMGQRFVFCRVVPGSMPNEGQISMWAVRETIKTVNLESLVLQG